MGETKASIYKIGDLVTGRKVWNIFLLYGKWWKLFIIIITF